MATRIDGRALAADLRAEVAGDVEALADEGVFLSLAAVLVGEDPAARAYLRTKEKACKGVGIRSRAVALPNDAPATAVREAVEAMNDDDEVTGIVVEQPLPPHLDAGSLLEALDPRKDVDGLHPLNLGRLLAGRPILVPATPLGVQELLLRSGRPPAGRDVVIVGRSEIVGKPLAALLSRKGPGGDATVTLCHSRTADLASHTRRGDIVVVAVGRPAFLRGDMVRAGAVVVDVGINAVEGSDGRTRLVGDVAADEVADVAAALTPVPGGVGPMTVAALLRNVVVAARLQRGETF